MLLVNEAVLGFISEYQDSGRYMLCIKTCPEVAPSSRNFNNLQYLRLGTQDIFNCCGSSSIEAVGQHFVSREQKQNFVAKLLSVLIYTQTYYYIADSYQLAGGDKAPFGNVATLLRELGAEEVDASKNKNHGPNNMHLHVWNPTMKMGGASKKYVAFSGTNDVDWEPLWWSQLSEEAKVPLVAQTEGIMGRIKEEQKRRFDTQAAYKQQSALMAARGHIRRGELDKDLIQLGWSKVNGQQSGVSPAQTVGSSTSFKWEA